MCKRWEVKALEIGLFYIYMNTRFILYVSGYNCILPSEAVLALFFCVLVSDTYIYVLLALFSASLCALRIL